LSFSEGGSLALRSSLELHFKFCAPFASQTLYGRLGRYGSVLLILLIRIKNQLPQLVLCSRVSDRTQERKTAAIAVDGVLPRGKGDVAAAAAAPFPDGEANELQPIERTFGEVQFGIGQLSRRSVGSVVLGNLDRHVAHSC